ncbi:MAG: hypothetical protein ACYTEZ_16735 [Planctomycetota bacterium]|jgi:hypothetical protein
MRLRTKTAVLVVAVLTLACLAFAADRLEFPKDFPGPPVYAEIGPGLVAFHTDTWAMIPFWRDPTGVPADFNLLDFFDNPGAFGAPLTIEGFVIRDAPTGPPIMAEYRGLPGMPVWFIAWPELQAAMADGMLKIGDLLAMNSLQQGVADYFHERFHPQGTDHPTTHVIVTHGSLPDGRRFAAEFAHGRGDIVGQERVHTRIEIK